MRRALVAMLILLAPIDAEARRNSVEGYPPERNGQGIVAAPRIDSVEGAVALFRIRNDWPEDSAADYLVFGQAFLAGGLRPADSVSAQYGKTILPAQIDVKALHPDGSVRHAAVTIATPPIKSGAELGGALVRGGNSFDDFNPAQADQPGLPIAITFAGPEGKFNIDAHALLRRTFAAGDDFWLDGPLVKEARIELDAAPHLTLRIDLRVFRDGDVRTSVAFANDKAFASGSRDLVYDVALGGAFEAKAVAHHRSSVWRKILWTGSQPKLRVIRDVEGLSQSGALLPLDVSFGASADAIAALASGLSESPLAPQSLQKYMPMTGGRGEIGIYPQWIALHIVAQNAAAERVMLANAEAAGAVPWHFRDETSGAPVSIERRRKFWADPRGLEPQYAPDRPHPDVFSSGDGGWTADHAHKPALTYVPYLLTADRHFADELAMQAAWALFGRWPSLREGGLKAFDFEEVRATAWSMRDLSDAAFILPDTHPLKSYFARALDFGLEAMRRKYVDQRAMREAGELEGYIEELIDREPERISPWQHDYVVLALWSAARRGSEDARALLAWTGKFHAGRFLNADLHPTRATTYALAAKDGPTQRPYGSWAEVAANTFGEGGGRPTEQEGYPTMAAGYVGSAIASLVAIASETKSLRALDALRVLLSQSRDAPLWLQSETGGVHHHPQFLATLALRDGSHVTLAELSGTRRIKSRANATLFFGTRGKDAFEGGSSPDDIFGGGGNDVLAGMGGDDRIVGGAGDDILSGGAGRDMFGFGSAHQGENRIVDFEPEHDVILLPRHALGPDGFWKNLIEITPEGALLQLPQGGTVLLQEIDPSALSARNFSAFE